MGSSLGEGALARLSYWAGILLAAGLCGSASKAQSPTSAPAAQESACELHIWSAPNYITDIHGFFPRGSGLGDLETSGTRDVLVPDGQSVIEAWLSPEFISRTAESLDLSTNFGGPVSVILHPTTRREVNSIMRAPQRATESTSSCYHELYVRTIFLQRSAMLGTQFFVSWRLKTFTPEARRPRVVTSSATLRLRGFRVDRPQEEIRADLESALKTSLETFITGALNGTIR